MLFNIPQIVLTEVPCSLFNIPFKFHTSMLGIPVKINSKV